MDHLKARRDELSGNAQRIIDAAKTEERDLTTEETTEIREITESLRAVKNQIETIADLNEQRAAVAGEIREIASSDDDQKRGGLEKIAQRDPGHYRSHSQHSWFADKVRASKGDAAAAERLRESDSFTRGQMDDLDSSTRALTTTAADGGELVPTLDLQQLFVERREAGAVAAGLCTRLPMPEVGKAMDIPFMSGSTSAAIVPEGNTLSETDAVTGDETATVYMVAGQQLLSLQLTERSQPGADMVIMRNLAKRVAKAVDVAVIDGSGSGEPTGILGTSGIQAVTSTQGTKTFPYLYPKIGDVKQQIFADWHEAPNAMVVHPRRSEKWFSELDSSLRPLALPVAHGASNALAVRADNGAPVAEGFTGYHVSGLPVYNDGNVPILDGSGTNEDVVIIADWTAALLWLGPVIFEVSPHSDFDTGEIRVRARQYMAFTAAAAPDAFGKITGSDLTAPTF
jgi:HK97 family phage major capsid protein